MVSGLGTWGASARERRGNSGKTNHEPSSVFLLLDRAILSAASRDQTHKLQNINKQSLLNHWRIV